MVVFLVGVEMGVLVILVDEIFEVVCVIIEVVELLCS